MEPLVNPNTPNIYASRDYLLEQKQDEMTKQFNSRTEQYQAMIAKNIPNVNFPKEVSIDEPISNMDELVKRHLQEREQELLKYTPAPSPQSTHQPVISSNPPLLKISDLDAPIKETVIEFHTNDAPNNLGKNVHWTNENKSTISKEDFELLRTEMYNEIRNEIRNEFKKGFTELITLFQLSAFKTPIDRPSEGQSAEANV
jgi:hypothetical protein